MGARHNSWENARRRYDRFLVLPFEFEHRLKKLSSAVGDSKEINALHPLKHELEYTLLTSCYLLNHEYVPCSGFLFLIEL